MENFSIRADSLTPNDALDPLDPLKPLEPLETASVTSPMLTTPTTPTTPTVSIRLSDIVAFLAPDARLVGVHLSELRAGKSLDPLCIDSEWVEHWYVGPENIGGDGLEAGPAEPEYLGMGYALIEGNDRHAALVAHLGGNAQCQVIMQGLEPIKGWN